MSDYASIESRLLAHYSGCSSMQKIYARWQDAYVAFAAILFGCGYDEVTKAQRTVAKPSILGCGFGMSGGRLLAYARGMGVDMSEAEASRQVTLFRTNYPEIPQFWRSVGDKAIEAVKGAKRTHYG